jgi:hypothetical protein
MLGKPSSAAEIKDCKHIRTLHDTFQIGAALLSAAAGVTGVSTIPVDTSSGKQGIAIASVVLGALGVAALIGTSIETNHYISSYPADGGCPAILGLPEDISGGTGSSASTGHVATAAAGKLLVLPRIAHEVSPREEFDGTDRTTASSQPTTCKREEMTRYILQMLIPGVLAWSTACSDVRSHATAAAPPQQVADACEADCCGACGFCQTGGKPGPCGVCSACRRAGCPICDIAPRNPERSVDSNEPAGDALGGADVAMNDEGCAARATELGGEADAPMLNAQH